MTDTVNVTDEMVEAMRQQYRWVEGVDGGGLSMPVPTTNETRNMLTAALATQPQDQRIAELEANETRLMDIIQGLRARLVQDPLIQERDQALAREEQLREVLERLIEARDRADYSDVNRLCDEACKALSLTPPEALSKRDGEVLAIREALKGTLWMAEEWFEHGGDETTLADDYKAKLEVADKALTSTAQAAQSIEAKIRADEREKCAKEFDLRAEKADEAARSCALMNDRARNHHYQVKAENKRAATAIRNQGDG